MTRLQNRLIIAFISILAGIMMTVFMPCFSHADSGDGSTEDGPLRAGEPKATGHIISTFGEATADAPAEARARNERMFWGGFGIYEVPVTLKIDYENIDTSATYRLDVKAYNRQTGDKIEDYNMSFDISSPDGSISFDCSIMGPLMPDDYDFKFKLYVEGDESKNVTVEPEGEMSFTLRVRGIAENKILIDGDTTVDRTMYNLLTADRIEEGCQLAHSIKLEGLVPNQRYNMTADFVKVTDNDGWGSNVKVVKSFTNSSVTDEKGNLTIVTDLDVNDQLKEGEHYTVRYRITNESDSSDVYYYYPSSIDNDLITKYSLDHSYLLVIKTPEPPEPSKTMVDVDIVNFIEGTDIYLEGAELTLYEGGIEGRPVDTWTVGNKPHSIRLGVGEYTLVQTKVPSGYELADPVQFTVEDREGSIDGGNFIAYELNSNWKTESSCGFYIKAENSHEGTQAYCVNYGVNDPQPIDYRTSGFLYYTELKLEDDESFAKLLNPRYNKERTNEALKGVVYAGYPDNGIGLKERYSLSNTDFKLVTQAAVHYYTDSLEYSLGPGTDSLDFNGDRNLYDAYMHLISGELSYPKGMTVKIYIPKEGGYQSLIATTFESTGEVMVVPIYNKKPPEVMDDDNEKEKKSRDSREKAKEKKKSISGESDTGDQFPSILGVIAMLATFLLAYKIQQNS